MNKKQTRTNASLKISNEVLAKIAEVASTEIRGVASRGEYLIPGDKVVQIPGKAYNPVKIALKGDHVEVTVNIVVLQGYKATQVASSVQNAVKQAIQDMVGISVSKVNVRIADIKLNPSAQE